MKNNQMVNLIGLIVGFWLTQSMIFNVQIIGLFIIAIALWKMIKK